KPTRTSTADSLAEPPGGMGEDRVDLAGVGQEIGSPLRPVAIVLAGLRQDSLEFLDIADRRVAELRVGAKAAPNLVKRLLAGLGVETARHGAVSPRRHRSHISTAASLSMRPAISRF